MCKAQIEDFTVFSNFPDPNVRFHKLAIHQKSSTNRPKCQQITSAERLWLRRELNYRSHSTNPSRPGLPRAACCSPRRRRLCFPRGRHRACSLDHRAAAARSAHRSYAGTPHDPPLAALLAAPTSPLAATRLALAARRAPRVSRLALAPP